MTMKSQIRHIEENMHALTHSLLLVRSSWMNSNPSAWIAWVASVAWMARIAWIVRASSAIVCVHSQCVLHRISCSLCHVLHLLPCLHAVRTCMYTLYVTYMHVADNIIYIRVWVCVCAILYILLYSSPLARYIYTYREREASLPVEGIGWLDP